eukprot:scaffold358_cov343-Pavlova_lutheri.AAC.3
MMLAQAASGPHFGRSMAVRGGMPRETRAKGRGEDETDGTDGTCSSEDWRSWSRPATWPTGRNTYEMRHEQDRPTTSSKATVENATITGSGSAVAEGETANNCCEKSTIAWRPSGRKPNRWWDTPEERSKVKPKRIQTTQGERESTRDETDERGETRNRRMEGPCRHQRRDCPRKSDREHQMGNQRVTSH